MERPRVDDLLATPLDDDLRSRRWRRAGLAAAVLAAALVGIGAFVLSGGDGDEAAPPAEEPAPPPPTRTGYPPSRVLHEAVFTGSRVAMIGGAATTDSFSPGAYVEDVWAYDASTGAWVSFDRLLAPGGRVGHAVAYDQANGLVVLFGGTTNTLAECGLSGPCATGAGADTWTWDPASGEWDRRAPAVAPSARFGAAMAYDAESGLVVMFGGAQRASSAFANDVFADTWAYDPAADSWTRLAPPTSPGARAWHRMAYDPGADRILLFGGAAPGGIDGTVWSYDANNDVWEEAAATGPPPRWSAGVAFDHASRRLIVVGGEGMVETSLGAAGSSSRIGWMGDVWSYDPTSARWTEHRPLPGAIGRASAAYDPAADRVVVLVFDTTATFDVDTGGWEFTEPTGG